ncbi:MAG: hypothetical protein K6C10_04585 [Prevotella sp.]|nr:hypothetical protein [Prevotella sp.]
MDEKKTKRKDGLKGLASVLLRTTNEFAFAANCQPPVSKKHLILSNPKIVAAIYQSNKVTR